MNKFFIITILSSCLVLTSCFKDEPKNTECDIEEVWVHLDDVSKVFFQPSDTLQKVTSAANSITFEVKDKNVDLTAMAPQFKLTAGATISPASGTTLDFSNGKPQYYTVTGEDGQWKRVYSVSFRSWTVYTHYDFENIVPFYTKDFFTKEDVLKYYEWTDVDNEGTPLGNWATANAGYALSPATGSKPETYPAAPCDGYEERGVLLQTCATGPIAISAGKPIASGSLFLGQFDAGKGLQDPMRATMFGKPFSKKPLTFSGWFKYLPGSPVKGFNASGQFVEMPGEQDGGTIYAILYKNHDRDGNPIVLYGDNVQTSEYIVAKAIMEIRQPVTEWTNFSVDFTYIQDVDEIILNQLGYSLAIVCSSSIDGALFKGAVGSQLYVDEFDVRCEE